MTDDARPPDVRTRPTRRIVLLTVLTLLVYGAGANVGAGTVLFLAAGMAVGTAWSVTRFLRGVGDLGVRVDPTAATAEGRSELPVTVTVPPGVIGVVRLVPTLPPAVATELQQRLSGLAVDERWSTLPRSGTAAQVAVATVLARGDAQPLRLEVEATDVFGLVRRHVALAGPVIDVTPAVGAAAPFAADTVEGSEDEWLAHALAANGAPGTELRPWRPGEAVRAVHWAASERAAQLLLRPRGPETQQRRTLTVDDADWTREALDARCRDLAASADRLARTGVEVEVAAGGRVLPWGRDARRLLASLRPNAADVAAASPQDA